MFGIFDNHTRKRVRTVGELFEVRNKMDAKIVRDNLNAEHYSKVKQEMPEVHRRYTVCRTQNHPKGATR